ncbi:MAG: MBL fold metallo-hydrolase [Bacteroidota bacterium]|nr:MBL fold metallo-hydrolase [Bacteroidota bacterium]MDP4215410.1 MBL fold metallo-hydrolase [Bacteroidota bacterium]MDP4247075.1 MBL fold metallo-hydrolase [Bacteroidota bacterium]MDP4254388.1 MBL fold metallo-hydrolase [Bacteroidota bacterium]MDP4256747.1 MBL fold metallo-hydrolase [Bacteroidota bacterium]
MSYPHLKITFLGTGTSSGVPMIACECEVCTSADRKDNRLRSSILVESATTTLVIDTTPDFRYQMLRARVKTLDAVVFTHPHKDHIAGLDDIRAFNFFMQKPVDIYANDMTQESIIREFPYAFADLRYPGIPEVRLNRIDREPFMIGDIPIIPIHVWHLKMPVLGFRFGPFTYITDANRIEAPEKNKIRGSEIVVLNALRHEKHVSHYTLEEAIGEVHELAIPRAYFTHISHQLGRHALINPTLPAGMELAYDGLVIRT